MYTLEFVDDQVIIVNDNEDAQIYSSETTRGVQKVVLTNKQTKYLSIGANVSNLSLDNEDILACGEYTYLGVTFDVTGNANTRRILQRPE